MKTRDFFFELPSELIAQHPRELRGDSRLMVLERAGLGVTHSHMDHIGSYIEPGSIVVFNDSRVRKARIFGFSESGSRVELLLVEKMGERRWKALASKAKKQKIGKSYGLPDGLIGTVVSDDSPYKIIEISQPIDDVWFEQHGHVPLPPYIHRPDESSDADRYQTVYSHQTGSIAAPTAGLHFTERTIEQLAEHGVEHAFLTLHVGIGTFLPIRCIRVEDHIMHEEDFEITIDTAERLNNALRHNRPIIAVGTTTVRSLESAWDNGRIIAGRRKTRLFIKPGYKFNATNGLFTNFHTPESSLLVMVSAFAGGKFIKSAYQAAIDKRYRFFSYGDAMLIL